MSRELLKEIAEVFRERRGGITWVAEPLLEKIETELAQPEPEPVAYRELIDDNIVFGKVYHFAYYKENDSYTPLYAEPVDQSARIAELEAELAQAYKTVDENWVCHQQLAALQAKREPLSNEEIEWIRIRTLGESEGPLHLNFHERFARAIEQHHGINGVV